MDKIAVKDICMDLIKSDSENEVIEILKSCGYWDDNAVWRYYGDYENNYNVMIVVR